MRIDAKGMYYRELNEKIKKAVAGGETELQLDNINGQRYIGTGITRPVRITVHGVPGNDLASFMDGPEINVYANSQDGVANTMNSGTVVVHGSIGDVAAYGMRGGKLYVRDNAGYRVGIHMKEYKRQVPVVIIGGTAGDFFGEYMAGGILMLLGLDRPAGMSLAGDYLGTGMHGGVIYLRGEVDPCLLGREVAAFDLEDSDYKLLDKYLGEYCSIFGLNYEELMQEKLVKLLPVSSRPYGRLYAY